MFDAGCCFTDSFKTSAKTWILEIGVGLYSVCGASETLAQIIIGSELRMYVSGVGARLVAHRK